MTSSHFPCYLPNFIRPEHVSEVGTHWTLNLSHGSPLHLSSVTTQRKSFRIVVCPGRLCVSGSLVTTSAQFYDNVLACCFHGLLLGEFSEAFVSIMVMLM